MARRTCILVLLALTMTLAPTSTAKPRKRPRPSDGTYTLKVAGYIQGQGKADVAAGVVNLTLDVKNVASGATGQVNVTLRPTTNVSNNNPSIHVTGTGWVLGAEA